MAAKAEVLTRSSVSTSSYQQHRTGTGRRIAAAFAAWVRKGQLGSSSYTEMGRYTGARV